MPVAASSVSLILPAAFLPLLSAVAAATTPNEREVYTLVGAAVSMLLVIAYMRIRTPHVGIWPLAFAVLSTAIIGWTMPESIMWAMVHWGWLNDATVETMTRKLWALMGLISGLSGATLIVAILSLIQRRLPSALDTLVETWIPGPSGKPVKVTMETLQPAAKNGTPPNTEP